MEFCKNLEIQNKGELITLIQEAMQIIAQKSQKPQEDPRTQIEMLKLQTEQQENDKQREFEAIENQKNRLARLEEKVIDGEFKVADAQLKHHETLTTQQNTMKEVITEMRQGWEIAIKSLHELHTNNQNNIKLL